MLLMLGGLCVGRLRRLSESRLWESPQVSFLYSI